MLLMVVQKMCAGHQQQQQLSHTEWVHPHCCCPCTWTPIKWKQAQIPSCCASTHADRPKLAGAWLGFPTWLQSTTWGRMLGSWQQQILRLRAVFMVMKLSSTCQGSGDSNCSMHSMHSGHGQQSVPGGKVCACLADGLCSNSDPALCTTAQLQTINRVWVARRVLAAGSDAAGTDSGVDLDVTVNVPKRSVRLGSAVEH